MTTAGFHGPPTREILVILQQRIFHSVSCGIAICRKACVFLFEIEDAMIESLMTASPVTIGPDESVQRAAQLMDDFNVGALPVCSDSRLLGLVTDRDITVRATAVGLNPHLTQVHVVMSSPVRSCCTDQDISEVLRLMTRLQVRRVPVLDGNKQLVGIVSLGDVAERSAGNVVDVLRAISTPAQPDRVATPPPSGSPGDWALGGGRPRLFP